MPADDAQPLARDPFLRAFHARHPDVDLVVLPPDPEATDDEPPLTADDLPALAAAVRDAYDELATALGRDRDEGADAVTAGWHRDSRSGLWRHDLRAQWRVPHPHAGLVLRSLGETLLARGWEAGPRSTSTPSLEAVRDPVRLVARAQPVGVRLVLATRPRRLGDDAEQALRRARRERS